MDLPEFWGVLTSLEFIAYWRFKWQMAHQIGVPEPKSFLGLLRVVTPHAFSNGIAITNFERCKCYRSRSSLDNLMKSRKFCHKSVRIKNSLEKTRLVFSLERYFVKSTNYLQSYIFTFGIVFKRKCWFHGSFEKVRESNQIYFY